MPLRNSSGNAAVTFACVRGLRTEKSMEMSKSWLDHVPSCPNGELEICQRVIKSFGLDFCLGRRRDKTSAGYKCNFHSEPSSALLPVSVRFIERAFGSESLLSRELTKPSKTTNEREEVENWREDRLVEFFPFIPDALCPLLSFYSRVHDVKKHVWWGSEEGKNRSRIREETMGGGGWDRCSLSLICEIAFH